MALQKSILKSAYRKFFEEMNEAEESLSYAEAAERLLKPYDDFAKTGQDPSGDTLIAGKYAAAKPILTAGYAAGKGEEALKSALTTYWMGSAFKVAVPHATMSQEVTAVVTAVNTQPLNGIFTENYEDIPDAVNNLVDKLDRFTRTVTVLITGLAKAGSPPPTITATGKVS